MKIETLGTKNQDFKGERKTTFLIDQKLVVNPGSLMGHLEREQLVEINSVFVCQRGMEYARDLPELIRSTREFRRSPIHIYGSGEVLAWIAGELLDWTDIPNIALHELKSNEPVKIEKYVVIPVEVNKDCGHLGFIFNDCLSSIVFTHYTAASDDLWEISRKLFNVRAVFTEIGFPNEELELAKVKNNFTPDCLAHESTKMPWGVPIYVCSKINNLDKRIRGQIRSIREKLKLRHDIVILEERDVVMV